MDRQPVDPGTAVSERLSEPPSPPPPYRATGAVGNLLVDPPGYDPGFGPFWFTAQPGDALRALSGPPPLLCNLDARLTNLERTIGVGGGRPPPTEEVLASQVRVGDTLLLGPRRQPHMVTTTRLDDDRLVFSFFGGRRDLWLKGNATVKCRRAAAGNRLSGR